MNLGPRQRRYIKLLKTTRKKQIRRRLSNKGGYCSLGLAKCLNRSLRSTKDIKSWLNLSEFGADTIIFINDDPWKGQRTFKYIANMIENHPLIFFRGSI